MAKKKEKQEDMFYVGVKDPVEIRRVILESSKEMVQYLQRTERFKKIREEKEREMIKLKKSMKDLSSLSNKLRGYLPKTGMNVGVVGYKKARKQIPLKQLQLPKIEGKAIPQTEIQKLEKELTEIESRLKRMS